MMTVFDWPVGLEQERRQHDRLPGLWTVATWYAQRYDATGKWVIHTGLDLNLNFDPITGKPRFDADAHSPVYAIADGVCAFVGKLRVWGTVIITSHLWSPDIMIWARYAHVEAITVERNGTVSQGQQIARVGNADGRYPYHLHFDIARVDLGAKPWDWPGDDRQRVLRDYIDPVEFMREQELMRGEGARPTRVRVNSSTGLRVRERPNVDALRRGVLLANTIVEIVEQRGEWGRIEHPQRGWIMMRYTEPAG